jgi:xeroderma pigmentosum group C-complementing protein
MFDAEVFLSKEDFCKQARTMQGSRDFGAQLFCALLRSAAVEARLVCSLQPLPFSGTTKSMTPNTRDSQYIVISSDDHETSADDRQMPGLSPTPASRSRRLGRPQFTPARSQKTSIPGNMSTSIPLAYSLTSQRPWIHRSSLALPGVLG